MRKFLLCMPLMALVLVGMIGCSAKREWNHQQRQAMRQALRDYREMVYLNDLTDAEYLLFTDEVATDLETTYPVYAAFIEMPGVEDTVDMVVVETIVSDVQANHGNMRYFFPYEWLQEWGILPEGMKHKELRDFYECLAGSVNKSYGSLDSFVYAALNSTIDDQKIMTLALGCVAAYQKE